MSWRKSSETGEKPVTVTKKYTEDGKNARLQKRRARADMPDVDMRHIGDSH